MYKSPVFPWSAEGVATLEKIYVPEQFIEDYKAQLSDYKNIIHPIK